MAENVVDASEEWVKKAGGVEVYSKTWVPGKGTATKATVIFNHGWGEHCSRYNHIFTAFAQAGIKVVAFDQRGYGTPNTEWS